jgi:hypothetical protein
MLSDKKFSGRKRKLTLGEIKLARKVFGASLPYERIQIADFYLFGSNCAMTIASNPINSISTYTIYWENPVVFKLGADQCNLIIQDTFIHELTHAWQGHNSLCSQTYMIKSVMAQCMAGIKDAFKSKCWKGWDHHRSKAYDYSIVPGRPWNTYNVEQQARIVEDWFSSNPNNKKAGYQSEDDYRYSYIVNNIRLGEPS